MRKDIWQIKSFNFTGWNGSRIDISEAKRQIDQMIALCSVNTVTIAFGALQDHAYSTQIDWKGPHMLQDGQLAELIGYAHDKGLKVILKPMLNTRDGYWRAYIRFFDEDVPCEPKWGDWFRSYTEYMVHFARLSEAESADMLIIGCEMVGTDHRQGEWRAVADAVRQVYSGPITYNCDKYQEHNVQWWDALDAVSSSGYYPADAWDDQIKRIESVVSKTGKPFFFSEVGCPSTAGAVQVPNDWTVIGKAPVDLGEQEKFFSTMFGKCDPLTWHYGYCIWDWGMNPRSNYDPLSDGGYSVAGKPAQTIVQMYFYSRS